MSKTSLVRPLSILACGCILFAFGCASVQVIAPVADLNKKNAEALRANADRLSQTGDFFAQAAVQSAILNIKYQVFAGIIAETTNAGVPLNHAALSTHYQTAAQALRGQVTGLSNEQIAVFRDSLQGTQPIAAAVAFDNMTADDGASLRMKLVTINALVLPDAQKQAMRNEAIDPLRTVRVYVEAGKQVLAAFDALRAAVAEQADVAVLIADGLVTASHTGASGPIFVTSLVNDPGVLPGIAEVVKKTTKDADTRAAADKILKEVEKAGTK